MQKKLKVKTLKKRVWSVFSRYIRTKYSVNGLCTCFTCGTVKPINQMQAGHGISGRRNSILFLEEIVRPQCYGCNVGQGGMYEVFVPKLIDLYGRCGYEEFVRLKNTSVKFTVEDLLDMEADFKSRIEDLREAA